MSRPTIARRSLIDRRQLLLAGLLLAGSQPAWAGSGDLLGAAELRTADYRLALTLCERGTSAVHLRAELYNLGSGFLVAQLDAMQLESNLGPLTNREGPRRVVLVGAGQRSGFDVSFDGDGGSGPLRLSVAGVARARLAEPETLGPLPLSHRPPEPGDLFRLMRLDESEDGADVRLLARNPTEDLVELRLRDAWRGDAERPALDSPRAPLRLLPGQSQLLRVRLPAGAGPLGGLRAARGPLEPIPVARWRIGAA